LVLWRRSKDSAPAWRKSVFFLAIVTNVADVLLFFATDWFGYWRTEWAGDTSLLLQLICLVAIFVGSARWWARTSLFASLAMMIFWTLFNSVGFL
jgi:hypothetical protein